MSFNGKDRKALELRRPTRRAPAIILATTLSYRRLIDSLFAGPVLSWVRADTGDSPARHFHYLKEARRSCGFVQIVHGALRLPRASLLAERC